MTMFFAKKLNKKGFTLAELLIVVAIIAILVAIAVPIYTSTLARARYAVHESNGRALKSMAISTLLSSPEFAGQKLADGCGWTVIGSYTFNGETFAIDSITYAGTGATASMEAKTGTDTYTAFDGTADSVKAIGALPTGGSGKTEYKIVFTAQDVYATSITG